MNKPVKVGITGGIGSGKTIVTKLFSLLGVPVYNADERAKILTHTLLRDSIIEVFGTNSFTGEKLNRDFMAATVFKDKDQLEKLNSIVHPAVANDFKDWVNAHSDYDYVVKEAALLVETGSYKELDILIVVSAPEKLRIERIKERDPFRSQDEIAGIIDKQAKDDVKLKLADYIIDNGDTQLLIPQVLEIDKKIRQHL